LKWLAILALPALAIFGGWKLMNKQSKPHPTQAPADDNPAIVSPGASASPGASSSPAAVPDTALLGGVQVLNASADPALTTQAKAKLEKVGYKITTTAKASHPYTKTTVFFQAGQEPKAKELARVTGATVTEAAPENLDKGIPLTLVIGADFQP